MGVAKNMLHWTLVMELPVLGDTFAVVPGLMQQHWQEYSNVHYIHPGYVRVRYLWKIVEIVFLHMVY